MATVKTYLGNIRGIRGEKGEKGEKGDPFTYEDLTTEQIDAFRKKVVADVLEASSICYVSTVTPTSDVGNNGDICIVKE